MENNEGEERSCPETTRDTKVSNNDLRLSQDAEIFLEENLKTSNDSCFFLS